MNELISIGTSTIGEGTIQTVNARSLHDFLGARRDFSEWIKDRIKRYEFTQGVDFVIFPKTGENPTGVLGRPVIDYHISLGMAKELAMVERNEKGKQARLYFIECEKVAIERRVQLPDFTNPIIAARAWADEVEQKMALQQTITEQAPKVEFATQIEESVNSIPVGVFAKVLNKHGIDIGQNRLFAWMRDKGYLMGDNIPYQHRINQGWFEVKETIAKTKRGMEVFTKTLITGKGQLAIANALKNDTRPTRMTFLPGMEAHS